MTQKLNIYFRNGSALIKSSTNTGDIYLREEVDAYVSDLIQSAVILQNKLKEANERIAELEKWVPIESVELGKMVILKGGGWRHEWAGQVVNKDTGECILDSPTPEHKVGIHFATHWKPLLAAPKIIQKGMGIIIEESDVPNS